jgi:glyoxalase family protein
MKSRGIHHITAIAGDAQRNLDFYAGALGLRLVKRTVNFDAPEVYHLYYGDELGRPGTILTFFPYPGAGRGKRGAGEATALAFSVPSGSLDFWNDRLSRLGIAHTGREERFGEGLLSFEDPDGMVVELVADASVGGIPGWAGSAVGADRAIRKFHGATIMQRALAPASSFLVGVLGFAAAGIEGERHRFILGPEESGTRIDILVEPQAPAGRQSAGSVHHIAWRAADDEEQLRWRAALIEAGGKPTEVIDRCYFHSVYFREPGGLLFEIATDPPGFPADESLDSLGSALKLPRWLEPRRASIERVLPPLTLPAVGVA